MSNYLLLILTSICWGSWGNAIKFTKNYKQNLFYLDFTIFSLMLAVLIWIFGGNNINILSSKNIIFPLLGGVLFAFGNLLLVKSIDKYGFSLSFPSIIGGAVIVGGLLNYIKTPINNLLLFLPGLILIFSAIAVDSYLYKIGAKNNAKQKPKRVNFINLVLAAVFIGIFPLFWNYGSKTFNISELFLVLLTGHFLGIIIAALFAKYLTKSDLKSFEQTPTSNHLISSIGALVWVFGTYLNMSIGTKVGFGVSFVVGNIAPLFSAVWGIFYWKEINMSPKINKFIFSSMTMLFLSGVILIGKS